MKSKISTRPFITTVARMLSLMLDNSGASIARVTKTDLQKISLRPKLHWYFMERLSHELSRLGITIYKAEPASNEFVLVGN